VGVYCDGRVEPLICDETITAESGEVTSPNFPQNYPDMHKKTTCIIPASGNATTLHFTNFNTEQDYDFVTLKDGTGAVLSQTSGATAPADVTGSTIVIKFASDQSVNAPGWRAVWGTGSSD
jgi:cubilin